MWTALPFRLFLALCPLVASGVLIAQSGANTPGGQGGQGGQGAPAAQGNQGAPASTPRFSPARPVVRAGDVDHDGEVSAAEWRAYLDEVSAGDAPLAEADGDLVQAWMMRWMIFEADPEALTLDGVLMAFEALDRNADFVVSGDEFPRADDTRTMNRIGQAGARRFEYMLSLPIRAADVDGDRNVSEEEWGQLVDGIGLAAGDRVDADTLVRWIRIVREGPLDDGAFFTPGAYMAWVDSTLDDDGDGTVTRGDLEAFFREVDSDSDGRISADELSFRGGRGGRGQREAAPTEPLMPFQRNLEDALALVRATGKPLLICVNTDGETASESLALRRYRDPAFVELVSGFIPVLASPNRRNPRDHDDLGRRILDDKFGRLVNGEHIGIEPTLFARYFDGRRVAPRHLAVDAEGNILFDLFLLNDLTEVDAALREHGRPGDPPPDPATMSESELFSSPDAVHRTWLEDLFERSDAETRARFAGLALSRLRQTQHPEILRLALFAPEESVRLQATWTIAQHADRTPPEFFVPAFRIAAADPVVSEALVGALGRLAQESPERDIRRLARRLRLAFTAVEEATPSVLSVERWRVALAWAGSTAEPGRASGQELERRLADLKEQELERPDDRELALAIAATSMQLVRHRQRMGGDTGRALSEVRQTAGRATSEERPDGRALAYLAWATELAGDNEAAGAWAEQAVQHLLPWAASPLASRALSVLARERARAIADAHAADESWPAEWYADLVAAHRILLEHPHGTDDQALAFLELLDRIEVTRGQDRLVQAALERFPRSDRLHGRLRMQVLRDEGAVALEQAYDGMDVPRELSASFGWYEGLAQLAAAERHVTNQHGDQALDAYARSAERFRVVLEMGLDEGDAAASHLCLALMGTARVHVYTEDWEAAVAAVREGLAVNRGSVWMPDGLGQTPNDTARFVHAELVRVGEDQAARDLRLFLEDNGVRIGG